MRLKKGIVFASWVSIAGNSLLALLKLIVGFFSGSFAVIADGIDSSADIVSSLVTLVAARVVTRPPNIKFPYGYIRADTVATKVLSMFIFLAGSQLAISSLSRLITNEAAGVPARIAFYVTLFSILGKYMLSIYLKSVGKKNRSTSLITMAKNMRNDILISSTVLVGLFASMYFKIGILDKIVSLGVSIFIMIEAIRIFLKSNTELMDGIDDPNVYQKLFDILKDVDGAHNPHRVRARKIGEFYMVNLDLEVDPDISVLKAHDIAKTAEIQIKNNIENVYDVMVHIEPRGNLETDEKFGISEKVISQSKRRKRTS